MTQADPNDESDGLAPFEMVVSAAELGALYRRAPEELAEHAHWLNRAAHASGIERGAELAAFLAQLGHETAGLKFMREIWNPATCHWQTRYQTHPHLGNIAIGDDYRFRGGGCLQLTGRANYARCGARYGMSADALATMIHEPKWAALSATWYWLDRDIGTPARAGDFDEVTRRINPGMLHQHLRMALYERALRAAQA